MDLQIFETDKQKELEGTWVDIEFRGQVGQFKIARAGNEKFNRIYARLKNQKRFADPMSDEAQEYDQDCLIKAMAEAVLIDTGDEITNKGEPVSYSTELGYKLLSEYSELLNQVAIAANDFEQFAAVTRDGQIKN